MNEFRTDLIHFGYVNLNGRMYQEKNINLKALNGMMLVGELGFPPTFEVNLSHVSHIITDLEIVDDVLWGKITIVNTSNGKILKELVNNDSVVFRPRGSGSVNSDGTISDYTLRAFDAVDKTLDPFDRKSILRRKKINKLLDNIGKNK